MNAFTKVMERVDVGSLVPYLLFGVEPFEKLTDKYSEKLDTSLNEFFDNLKELLPDIDKEDEDLGNVACQLALEYGEVHFQLGIIIGFQLYKKFEQGYDKLKTPDVEKILRDCAEVKEKVEKTEEQSNIL